jgi:hypothetical protein
MRYLLRVLMVKDKKTVTTLDTPAKAGVLNIPKIPDSGSSPE